MKILVAGLAAGLVFGAATSLVNALSSPYVELGMPLVGTVWAKAAKVLSLLMDAGSEVIVWTAAVLGAGWAVYRFRAARRVSGSRLSRCRTS
ncbi:hypothetical protein ACFC08_21905 [Streptomyces sp. NPDC056112]|uniref:hypothetical protein n=1 Tax=Streptomyces sp. NPDC056112 TaxID=3345715 RepID=UPI0035E30207